MDARVGADLAGRSLGQFDAEIHHDDAIDQTHDEIHVVLDEKNGQPLAAQRAQESGERGLFQMAQAGGRFVEDDQEGGGGERPRERRAPASSPDRVRT